LLPLAFFIPWLSSSPTLLDAALIFAGAFSFVLSLYLMYLAFLHSEVSHVAPLIGAFVPLFILAVSGIFLGERISGAQIFGIILLSFGTLLISIQKKQPHHDFNTSIKFGIISAALFSIFHITAKLLYTKFGFSHGVFYLWGTIGIIGLSMLWHRDVRAVIFPDQSFWQRNKRKLAQHFSATSNTRLQILTVAADKLLSALGIFLVQYAVSLGSVTKVNALSGYQFGLLVVLVALMSKFSPRLFRESYQDGEFKQEIVAVAFIAVGLVYLVR
jgi:uncharacterized membrane protein